MVQLLEAWVNDNAEALRERGYDVRFERSAAHVAKASAWVDIDSDAALGQLIVWETGEIDLRIGDRDATELRVNEHRHVDSADALDDALRGLVSSI